MVNPFVFNFKMDALFYIICIVFVIYFFLPKKEKPLIVFGELHHRVFINLQKNAYRAEEFLFDNSIESFKYYKKVVNQFAEKPNLVQTKYDLYDWSFPAGASLRLVSTPIADINS